MTVEICDRTSTPARTTPSWDWTVTRTARISRWLLQNFLSSFNLCEHDHKTVVINTSATVRHFLPSLIIVNMARTRGKYHCTVDFLFDLFGLACFVNKNKNCQLSYSWFQTSQTGGQRYSDTSPFGVPCQNLRDSCKGAKALNLASKNYIREKVTGSCKHFSLQYNNYRYI